MDEQGLASVSMQQAPTAGGGSTELTQEDYSMIMEEVVRLLQEGVSPEELIAMGVPEEMVREALEMLGSGGGNAAPAQPQVAPVPAPAPVSDGGLAMSGM